MYSLDDATTILTRPPESHRKKDTIFRAALKQFEAVSTQNSNQWPKKWEFLVRKLEAFRPVD
jgi:hypothetical protein